jgi:hypothetical protein
MRSLEESSPKRELGWWCIKGGNEEGSRRGGHTVEVCICVVDG